MSDEKWFKELGATENQRAVYINKILDDAEEQANQHLDTIYNHKALELEREDKKYE